MQTRTITASPSEVIVEQLVASGVKYVFNNSGSREAPFFDALHAHPQVQGVLALHEGSVAAMATGYAQVNLDPAVMVVHLGAGLAQSLGQLINAWYGGLPVVVITYAGDTGSGSDRINLDLHHSFGPTSISAPFTKATWSVIEPEGLPNAIHRALKVASTPPTGPVHLAVYDRLVDIRQCTADIIEGEVGEVRAGGPSESEVSGIVRALEGSHRPLLYVGDGVWKSGAGDQVAALAGLLGAPVAGDVRALSVRHPLHCGPLDTAVAAVEPDLIACIGVRHQGSGKPDDFSPLRQAAGIVSIGSHVENMSNIPGIDLAVLADERRTLQQVLESVEDRSGPDRFAQRRAWAREQAAAARTGRRGAAGEVEADPSRIRPWRLAEALDGALERLGGGHVVNEQFAVPLGGVGVSDGDARNVYVPPPGGSEGYGIGATIGAKLAAPELPVVGLVGDGSLYFADSGLWSAVNHKVPVLFVIANNQSYGIVAGHFGTAAAGMSRSGEYAGVSLEGIDPVKIAEGFGVEAIRLRDESLLEDELSRGLTTVQEEGRPFLLDVLLPLGLPEGGRPAKPFHLA